MANAILKRLVQKGLLKIQKVNNRNIRYVVSPRGMERIARRSYRYFRQTVKNVVYYKEAIEELLDLVEARGVTEIVLIGASDLDFIVEHLCAKHRLGLAPGAARPYRGAVNGQRFSPVFRRITPVPALPGHERPPASSHPALPSRGAALSVAS